jgi:hypothetical protein
MVEDHVDDLDMHGRIILKWLLEMGCGDAGWIHLAQDTAQ